MKSQSVEHTAVALRSPSSTQPDLAEEPAGRHRPDESAGALDVDGARHDDVERIGRLAFAHEDRLGRRRGLDRQRGDRLQAPRVQVREDRERGEHVGLVHGPRA